MASTLAKEQAEDEEVHHKLECWCATNKKEKTAATHHASRKITDLTNSIQEHAGKVAQLTVELKQLDKDLGASKDSLKEGRALRDKQAQEFDSHQKDMIRSIASLRNGIEVLSKHHKPEVFLQARTIARHLLFQHGDLFSKKAIAALQVPASGAIFGVLKSMKDTFEKDLSDAKEVEATRQDSFAEFQAAKTSEMSAIEAATSSKKDEHADRTEKLSASKADLEGTRAALAADTKFLSDLNLKCQQAGSEYQARQKTRSQEIQAVSEATSILSNDASHELADRTVNTVAFFQVSATKVLRQLSKKSAQLARLAENGRLDTFDKIHEAIDKMVIELKKAQSDEVKHRDFCKREFNTNEASTLQKKKDIKDVNTKVSDLEGSLKELELDIAAEQKEVAETKLEIKRAGETRESENAEFQSTVKDQRDIQTLVQRAVRKLAAFYESLIQTPRYEKNQAGSGLLVMLRTVIEDSKHVEQEAVEGERSAQKAYEDFVKNADETIATVSKQIIAKSERSAEIEAEMVENNADLESEESDLDKLADYSLRLHNECDFVLKNFNLRQKARSDEIESMQAAKSALSGAQI